MVFDIRDFYPSISEKLLRDSIEFAERIIEVTGVSDTVTPSKLLVKYCLQKGRFEGFIVKYRNTDQLLGNFPSPAGDEIP